MALSLRRQPRLLVVYLEPHAGLHDLAVKIVDRNISVDYVEFAIRIPKLPKPSRRFSLRMLLLAISVVAIALAVYVSKAQFNVVALVEVSTRVDVPFFGDSDYDYFKARASILEQLQSKTAIQAAILGATKRVIPVEEIQRRLDVHVVGSSELVRVSLRGRKFRDSKETLTAILDGIIQRAASESEDDETVVKVRRRPVIR